MLIKDILIAMLFKFNIVLVVLMVLMLTGVVKFGDEVIISKLENVYVGYGNENLEVIFLNGQKLI